MAFNKTPWLLLACAILLGSSQANAQLYKWTDANGKVHYSDTVPPTANDRARKEIGSDGIVRGQMDRALTPEERRAAAVRAVEEEKLRSAKEERERRDKALLVTYATLADFDRVRDRALAVANDEIEALKKSESSEAEKLAALRKQVDPNSKRPIAPKLRSDIDASESDLRVLTVALAKKVADRDTMTKNYATERVRLAGLIAADTALKQPSAPPLAATTPAKR